MSKPTMAERGKMGADSRWGPKRRFDLRDLTPEQRADIAARVAYFRSVNADAVPDRDDDRLRAAIHADHQGCGGYVHPVEAMRPGAALCWSMAERIREAIR